MNRRRFLSLISGAIAAVAGGLGMAVSKPKINRQYIELTGNLDMLGGLGPFIVTPVQGGSYVQAKLLQDLTNRAFASGQMLAAIEARRNEAFEEMVRGVNGRVNEAHFYGVSDAYLAPHKTEVVARDRSTETKHR